MYQNNSKKVLVLGVGNLLLGDEGIGIHFIEEMKKELLPPDVELVDGGTAGIDLLYLMETACKVIIVDCAEAGKVPGTIFRIPADELSLETTEQLVSLHDINLTEMLAIAKKLDKLPPTLIFGIQPEVIGYQTDLTPTLQKKLPRLVQLVKKEILQILKQK